MPYNEHYYNGRNYYLFSILADVRNGYGDGYVEYICETKGVPDDASIGYKHIVNMWGGDGHSHSYFTLSELLDIDWDKYNKDGWIDSFLSTIDRMKEIDSDSDKVRAVFFFDN